MVNNGSWFLMGSWWFIMFKYGDCDYIVDVVDAYSIGDQYSIYDWFITWHDDKTGRLFGQKEAFGSVPPAVVWSRGPRVTTNFG